MIKTLITRDQFKITPWKNGAGQTAEIDISPKGTDFRHGDFKWRISSARIENENQFSQFPTYSRILTVLSGEGLLINNQELGPFEIFEFEGEDRIDCIPIDGPVEDLNIIFLRDRYRASMQLLNFMEKTDFKLEEGIHFFLPLLSQVKVDEIEFSSPDILKVEGSGKLMISAQDYPSPMLWIRIWEDTVVQ